MTASLISSGTSLGAASNLICPVSMAVISHEIRQHAFQAGDVCFDALQELALHGSQDADRLTQQQSVYPAMDVMGVRSSCTIDAMTSA
jgi:hypothetical protein